MNTMHKQQISVFAFATFAATIGVAACTTAAKPGTVGITVERQSDSHVAGYYVAGNGMRVDFDASLAADGDLVGTAVTPNLELAETPIGDGRHALTINGASVGDALYGDPAAIDDLRKLGAEYPEEIAALYEFSSAWELMTSDSERPRQALQSFGVLFVHVAAALDYLNGEVAYYTGCVGSWFGCSCHEHGCLVWCGNHGHVCVY